MTTTITLPRAIVEQALEALDEATSYTSCPTWSPSMTEECKAAASALRSALAQEPCEPLEVLKRALEIIAVGDSKNPQQDAADALVDIGFWSGEAPQPQPKAESVEGEKT